MVAHVLAFPWPLQGHINPMLHLASALLDAGLRVTFLHTEHNLRRFIRVPPHHPRLRLLSVPDGLPDDHPRSVDGLMELVESMRTVASAAYRALLLRTMESEPDDAVTCVVADGVMPFAISVAEGIGVPALAFRTESACGFLAYLSVPRLLELGELPVPSDEQVHGVAGMEDFLRRRDLPRVVPVPLQRGNGEEEEVDSGRDPVPVLQTIADTAARCGESRALILNTSASMEGLALSGIAPHMRDVFAVGPLHARRARARQAAAETETEHVSGDDMSLTAWLDGHEDRSVVYVNLGSLTIISSEQLAEFLHGLVAAGYAFLCVFRRDMLHQMTAAVSLREAVEAVAGAGIDRALVVEWALQRDAHHVLRHRAVGCFLTHGGWNSTLEAAVEGVPAVCWPFFADQQTNSRFVGAVWKTGLDMKDVCDRAVVEKMVREAMESPEIRASAQSMARQLRLDVAEGGSSSSELERLVGLITELSAVKPAPALT
ncbi:myricetin 3-O-rhamnoside 1,2-glucosyltransferase UGT709G2-like [Hordeum vulgare subsp. vulgare]|uniref:Glycosyltransferase n=1 Tax=Hordeum vulgare subsp. vulgare TaxID=112509 RepID=A0A8I6Z1E0_HORVV|nr:myricetin 3-O-rhamnoside 1,2-glucosyltransferase UGT709G2-like [Hordeum vulgare subsp. vulgare]